MKICKKCGEEKGSENFYPHPGSKDRLQPKCKPCCSIISAEYYAKHRASRRKEIAEWKIGNPKTAAATSKSYRIKNKAKVYAKNAKHRAARIQSVPSWHDDDAQWMIEEIYSLCALRSRLTNVTHQVDHIVPLNSKVVCGLHTPLNLRVITASENRVKGNRF